MTSSTPEYPVDARRMADSIIVQFPILSEKWDYDWGVTLTGIEALAHKTGDARYFDYIQANIDHFVTPDGSLPKYDLAEYSLDRINTGKLLFGLYARTGSERYLRPLQLLRSQLKTHPRTQAGGFWHKLIYPHQMWLDGLYMAGPFHSQYARTFNEPAEFDDIALQFTLMEKVSRDAQTGLLYHGWDESKQQRWANPITGCSPHFWCRAMGWYAMAIVDVLDTFPAAHPRRPELIAIFERLVEAILKVQDPATGLWYQVLDQGTRAGNYLEASGSAMFTYSMLKAARMGIAPHALAAAKKAYAGMQANFVRIDEQGLAHLDRNCRVAGLGGTPYRDGSYEYYISQAIVSDDYKGLGPFILSTLEMDALA